MISMARISLLSTALLLLALGGCTSQQPTDGAGANSPWMSQPANPSASSTGARRFQDSPLEGRTAVESAIELSEKYARLSDQMLAMREENGRLKADNDSLRQQLASTEARLAQTQKELGEANDLLIEMLTELNNWKNNILGFRGEMREAAKAQLEALLKVLEILGGEVEAGTVGQRSDGTLYAEPNTRSIPLAEDVNDAQ